MEYHTVDAIREVLLGVLNFRYSLSMPKGFRTGGWRVASTAYSAPILRLRVCCGSVVLGDREATILIP